MRCLDEIAACQQCKVKRKVCCSDYATYCYCADCCPWKREHTLVEHGRAWRHYAERLNAMVADIHERNAHWWVDITKREQPRLECNIGEKLMLIVSELAEAMEGHRKNLMDDKLPHRPMLEVELADALIRIFDLAGGLGLDLGGAFEEKLAYNATRADHKLENRLLPNGKKY